MYHHFDGCYPVPLYWPHAGWMHHGYHSHQFDYAVFREEVVDPSHGSKEFFIGGAKPVHPVLEYMPLSGATSPALEMATTAPGGPPHTWSPASMGTEYAVKDDFSAIEPGTRVAIKVDETIARIRWFETIEYHHH
ncbi:MAG: hypothetical protein JW768_00205 [Chitinispirillaceae bacterium]|nr:hypothetical protein [Chitinispirillaceae bacterium]